jgi:hypothetical protein
LTLYSEPLTFVYIWGQGCTNGDGGAFTSPRRSLETERAITSWLDRAGIADPAAESIPRGLQETRVQLSGWSNQPNGEGSTA